MNKNKSYLIEALSLHKELCSYFIDKRISFTCFNGGLRAIEIHYSQPFNRNFLEPLMEEFSLEITRETKEHSILMSKSRQGK